MSRIEHIRSAGSLEVRIKPGNEGEFQTYFLGVWLVAWAFGWVSGVSSLLSEPIGFNSIFMLVWTTFWTIGGLFAGLWLAWKTNGFEQLIIDSDQFKIKHNVFGFGPEKVYSTSECQNLRAAGYFGNKNKHSLLHQIGMKGGVVVVESNGQDIRFGVSLEENEAQEIVDLLSAYIKT
ncbi:hypothetical protein O5O45_07065 [Hahella aquimaris]|uniref:hypothetical protein n=1 Tax=Hahella sp. HNIBRBA332 TaxID=3015983 RepID=UPI00273B46C5|nr:hypothetical protein [Hahella sp. HNIBRBA332]WLQ15674.1 hypothetical protein O5O45_07065 [Hahella sp. HNIBRBA332]